MATHYYDHVHRSITKALTFRTMIIASDVVIIFLVTHRYDLTIGVLFFSNISSTIIYFVHERMWNHVHWGKIKRHNDLSKKNR